MGRSIDYYYSNTGWNTTSDDYSIHGSRTEQQMPSNLTGFPRYPNIHTIFNETLTLEEKQGNPIHHQKHYHGGQDEHKKVRFAEQKKTTTQVVDHNKGKQSAVEDISVDSEADGFIQKKHKYFDMCKTFQAY